MAVSSTHFRTSTRATSFATSAAGSVGDTTVPRGRNGSRRLLHGFSALGRRVRRVGAAGLLACGVLGAVIAPDQAFAEIQVATYPAVAVRGGDLVVPLVSTDGRDQWPTSLPVTVGGVATTATVAWIVPRSVMEPGWTTPASPVSIVPGDRTGTPPPLGSALAVFTVPRDADGEVEILDARWSPDWLPYAPMFDPDLSEVGSRGMDADPPLDDPMEWFRWVVLAGMEDARPPAPRLGTGEQAELGRRVAISIASEWRAGLERVASSSPGVAREIAERLVATVTDERRPRGDRLVAAWPTEPRELASLRGILLDPGRTPIQCARAGLAWFEARPPFVAWTTATVGDSVTIEFANPTQGELVVLASWSDVTVPPEAVVLPPRSLLEHVVDRPSFDDGAQPLRETLDLVVDRRGRRMIFEQRDVPVRPPGGSFGSISLSLRLAAANGEFVEVPPAAFGTGVILRRRGQGWQVFVEAMAVEYSEGDRIHLIFGPAEGSEARLEVGSDGSFEVTTSLGQNGLDVQVRRFSDRWRAEIDIPESWLANSITDSEAGSVLIGFRRDGPGTLVSYAGPPPPTWRREIPVRPFAIADWDRPRPPGADGSR
ncbi:MAG: hypothetical protein GY895_09245 [Phycisphaera sp.]|nr:hypothetical protein [Phycisphaera sp.]